MLVAARVTSTGNCIFDATISCLMSIRILETVGYYNTRAHASRLIEVTIGWPYTEHGS